MKRIALLGISAVAILAAAAFAFTRGGSDGIDRAAILAAVNAELAGSGWTAETIEITEQSEETRGEARLLRYRFTASARTTEPLFEVIGPEERFVFVRQTLAAGTQAQFPGEGGAFTAPGVRNEGAGLIGLRDLDQRGVPIAAFRSDGYSVVIEGTPEATAARAAIAAARQAEMDALMASHGGEWIGQSSCGARDFEHRLTIAPGERPRQLAAEVVFSAIHPDTPITEARHTASGGVNSRTGELTLNFGSWNDRPAGVVSYLLRLTPEVTPEGGGEAAVLSGRANAFISGMSGNCDFRLLRPAAHAAEREARLEPLRTLLGAIEPGRWIEGSQTGPTRGDRQDWPARTRITAATADYIQGTLELMGFHANNSNVMGLFELDFTLFLNRGTDALRIEFGRLPRNFTARNLYSRGSFCSDLRLSLDPATGVLIGSNNDRRGCIDELRLPLIPS